MKINIIILGLVTICSSCALKFKINYQTKDIQRNQDQGLSKIILDIEELADKRKEDFSNTILFTNGTHAKYNGRAVLINSENHYKRPAQQISRMVVNHLNIRNSFKKVVKDKKDSADYYITGTLTKLYGIQDFSMSSALYVGTTGASSDEMTNGQIIIEIADLKIYDKNNQIKKDIGTFKKEYEGYLWNGGIWSCIYINVNSKLKEYISELITIIELEIKKME